MNIYMKNLCKLIKSGDADSRDKAIVEIANILENSFVECKCSSSGNFVPQVENIVLSKEEQLEVVEKISELIDNGIREASMYWILSKTTPDIGLKPILYLTSQYGDIFDQSTIWQVTVALDTYLSGPIITPADYRGEVLKQFPVIVSMLDKWNTDSDDDGFKRMAKKAVCQIQKMLE